MSITVNGQSRVPPGFRFHPTEEELLNYYLRKKVACEKIDLDVIRDIDLNKLEPWEIQEKCKVGSTPQNDWYFFSHKDKKYPTGTRTNRATAAGFWKATGRDKVIHTSLKRIGMRKTLVFYTGRAPHGQKSDWIMHEYRLDDPDSISMAASMCGENTNQEDGWVVCRVFKKKNFLHKSSDISNNSTAESMVTNDGMLDQIIRRSCKQEANRNILYDERLVKLPALESYHQQEKLNAAGRYTDRDHQSDDVSLSDWVMLDRLVASQLNGQFDGVAKQITCLDDTDSMFMDGVCSIGKYGDDGSSNGDGDLWSLASSASDRISLV